MLKTQICVVRPQCVNDVHIFLTKYCLGDQIKKNDMCVGHVAGMGDRITAY